MRAENSDLITVVGVGAGGWSDLSRTGMSTLAGADVVFGSSRQLELLPPEVTAERVPWPSPLLPALPGLLDAHRGRLICVLASGDPMFHGIGATLARVLGPERLHVVPHPSSVSLACARMGWAVDGVEVLSAVARPLARVRRVLAPGARVLVLSEDATTPAALAALLVDAGYGGSVLTVLEQLGGPAEHRVDGTAAGWSAPPGDPLNVVAVACVGPGLSEVPGLPDDAYDHDGQLTKREVRAVTLAHLAPRPGELLWDVGAGNGSIGIEWLRAHRTCRAVAVEADEARAARIAANAAALGVPTLQVVRGRAPDALAGLPAPDAVFIGGGITNARVLDACRAALRPGGRLVANAVTLEAEAVLVAGRARCGGSLVRIEVSRAAPLGAFTGWRPAMPVTIWSVWR